MAKFQEAKASDEPINLAQWKKEFTRINKNYLEPEYQIDPNSSFTKIMDLNLRGEDSYSGFITKECIDDKFDEDGYVIF